ncbi:MAG: Copper resistance protein CopC [uncultured Paraburkholderia sp.]|nr:MAG: Copper resistance protein CopC [uncultured Paraburkholderia sp.]CAH2941549.1 MAG: Copper resistance protein CopC [uncultured Paraburkholderia sp.]
MKLFSLSHYTQPTLRALRASALGAVALVAANSAFAHAHLVSSESASNAEVAAPHEVTIHFTEPLEPAFSKITLSTATGTPAASAASQVAGSDAKVMHLTLPQLSAGRYTAHWTAVATDDHRTQGDFMFTVK